MSWLISLDVKYIKEQMGIYNMEVVHALIKGNSMTVFFTNYVVNFVGTDTNSQSFYNFKDISKKAKANVQLEKANIRTRKIQN